MLYKKGNYLEVAHKIFLNFFLLEKSIYDILIERWVFSSAGRASVWRTEGHRFDPYSTHQIDKISLFCRDFLFI